MNFEIDTVLVAQATSTPKKTAYSGPRRRVEKLQSTFDVVSTGLIEAAIHLHEPDEDPDTSIIDWNASIGMTEIDESTNSIVPWSDDNINQDSTNSIVPWSDTEQSPVKTSSLDVTVVSLLDGDSVISEEGPILNESSAAAYFSKILEVSGCESKQCVSAKHHLTITDVWTARQRFDHLGQFQQRQWVLDNFHTNDTNFYIAGKAVCKPVWLATLGLSRSRFHEIKKSYNDGVLFFEQIKSPKSRMEKSHESVAWMKQFFDKVGDKMPDRLAIHLPSFMTQTSVYSRMKEDLLTQNLPVISSSHFYNLWAADFPHVTIPKENRFTKCDTCTLVKNELQKTSDPKERKLYVELLEDHNKLQRDQRLLYYDNRQAARQEPKKYLSIIIDGMDQNKTNLPHLVRLNKSACNMWVLRTHLSGALVHGRRSYAFVDLHLWPHDVNLTCTVLLMILEKEAKSGALPPTMYLQLDNCYRENKNQLFFAFMAYLVLKDVFVEVRVGFLMVGHTHEDIDQYFSKLSQYLKYNNAHTLPDFMAAVQRCYSDVSEATVINHIFDVKSWLLPHLHKLHNHSHYHIFRFSRDATGLVVMHYKEWNESQWEPTTCGIQLFKSFPENPPSVAKPTLDRLDFDKLTRHASQYRTRCGISETSQKWWIDHLEYLKAICSGDSQAEPTPIWPLNVLREAAQRQNHVLPEDTADNTDGVSSINASELPPHIQKAYQKQVGPHPKVYTGNYKPPSRDNDPSTRKTAAAGAKRSCPAGSGQTTQSTGKTAAGAKRSCPAGSSQTTQSTRKTAAGAKRSCPAGSSQTTQAPPTIKEGNIIAVCSPKYAERPQIAQVSKINSDGTLHVEWYDGTWNSNWKKYTYLEGGTTVVWEEDINIDHVVLGEISLTPATRLSAKTRKELQTLYKNY